MYYECRRDFPLDSAVLMGQSVSPFNSGSFHRMGVREVITTSQPTVGPEPQGSGDVNQRGHRGAEKTTLRVRGVGSGKSPLPKENKSYQGTIVLQ